MATLSPFVTPYVSRRSPANLSERVRIWVNVYRSESNIISSFEACWDVTERKKERRVGGMFL